jgi:predicted short-subunit dehydrogenase-like oxidoreductase (DUF2520 family)
LNQEEDNIENITIVGAGNMAWHLSREFAKAGLRITRIINRSEGPAKKIAEISGAEFTTDFSTSNEDSQAIILAVSDSCLEEVLTKINISNNIILHTSGSLSINVLSGSSMHYGVFYPFQTLTMEVETNFLDIPILTEASDEETHKLIDNLASGISSKVDRIDSEKRRKLHLAGVISNNFTNHLIALTFDYLKKNKINENIIIPLIKETFRKIEIISPKDAQTGPARRKNKEIIDQHLTLLNDDPELKNLYKAISDSIIAYYFR